MAGFRPIQYLGSKWRMLEQIAETIGRVTSPERSLIVDLFAGSGVVARRLAHEHPVLAADVQEYSRVIASAMLNPVDVDAGEVAQFRRRTRAKNKWMNDLAAWEVSRFGNLDVIAADIEVGSLALGAWPDDRSHVREIVAGVTRGRSEWATLHYYGGVYFSYTQAMDIDVIASWARSLGQGRDTALAAVLSTASELVSSVGNHFAQPIRPRDPSGRLKSKQLAAIKEKRLVSTNDVFAAKLIQFSRLAPPNYPAQTARADFRDTLAGLTADTSVVYADPPYTRDHYSRFYHVLETLALGDDPGISTMRLGEATLPSRGLYRLDRHQSPFSIVSEAPRAFSQMFEDVSRVGAALVLSYSPIPENNKPRARVIDLPRLVDLARGHFGKVEIVKAEGLMHSKFNAAHLNAPAVREAEVLIVAS
jgi:adenine-specific DNA-methyltransferase